MMTAKHSAAIHVALRVSNAIAVNEKPDDDDLLALAFAASCRDSAADELAYEVVHEALRRRYEEESQATTPNDD